MEVIKISPRGCCYGVVDVMMLAQQAAKDLDLPRPIYILGKIVHNQQVVDAFTEQGIITVDGEDRMSLLDKIDAGTVIFTAHGISPQVREKARAKGLTTVDATCPDVTKTHDLIREKTAQGYEIIYVGKKGHPEPEGAVGVAPGKVHLVERASDVEALNLNNDRLLVTNQTTMSQWDTKALMNEVLKKYPHVEIHNEICLATQVRQEAVAQQAGEADLTIVVGDPASNNSNRLAQVSEEIAGTKSFRIGSIEEINIDWLKNINKVAVTSGASTPTLVTKEVIDFLEQFDPTDESTWDTKSKLPLDRILPKFKEKSTS